MSVPIRTLLLSLLLIGVCGLARARDAGSFEALKVATFEEVWSRVWETHYDRSFGGVDWEGVGQDYRARLEQVGNEAELEALVEEMLGELRTSHFGILPAEAATLSETAGWQGGYAGFEIALAEQAAVIFRVYSASPAEEAGLRPGDRVLEIGQSSVDDLGQTVVDSGLPAYLQRLTWLSQLQQEMSRPPGTVLRLVVAESGADSRELSIRLKPYQGNRSPRIGHLGEMPVEVEGAWLDDTIAYLRFNVWVPSVMGELRPFIESLEGKAEGLIIDLRNNPGGIGIMAGGVAGLLVEQQVQLASTRLREGNINFVAFPQRKAFLGPVAVLVNVGSCSTSEIFALGLQEAGRIRVFGESTPGAALASVFTKLPNGAVMQSVLGEVVTPRGTRLEGLGVQPDESVALSPVALAAGRDTVIDAARQWLLSPTHETPYDNENENP